MDPRIADFIQANRDRLTREAITRQLIDAGYAREDIDATWERLASEGSTAGATGGRTLGTYVWAVYWLGAAIIVAITLISVVGGGGGFIVFGAGWLVAYLGLAYFPARALARVEAGSTATVIGLVLAAPLLVVLVGGGICLGTVAAILAGSGVGG